MRTRHYAVHRDGRCVYLGLHEDCDAAFQCIYHHPEIKTSGGVLFNWIIISQDDIQPMICAFKRAKKHIKQKL